MKYTQSRVARNGICICSWARVNTTEESVLLQTSWEVAEPLSAIPEMVMLQFSSSYPEVVWGRWAGSLQIFCFEMGPQGHG